MSLISYMTVPQLAGHEFSQLYKIQQSRGRHDDFPEVSLLIICSKYLALHWHLYLCSEVEKRGGGWEAVEGHVHQCGDAPGCGRSCRRVEPLPVRSTLKGQ